MIHSGRMTELPTTFGKYYLTDKLATGGMAEIFLGKLIGPGGFEKQLVIKQIHPALSGQRHFVDLFVAEAKTLVSLTHGNIVPVYELGVIDDTYFIAMEYIDGPTLFQLTEARFVGGRALEPALAGWITAELARGLDYAHRKGVGVVHRDLSPRNVMLSREGEVKIVDFGIAVGHGSGDDPGGDTGGEAELPTGSFAYMSPEQVARRPLTGQSDLFSLGVLAWEMLVGERLFARSTPEATLAAVQAAPIAAPSSRLSTVPARLDELVMRALERDPARRWSSAADLLAPLQRYLFSLDHTPGPREVAALVATTCPPTGRRPRTEPGPDQAASGEREADAAGATRPAGDGGPSTRALPARAGRQRPPTVREATFAAHVDLARALGQTPPSAPPPEVVIEPTTRVTPRPPPTPTGRPGRGRVIAGTVALGVVVIAVLVLLRPWTAGDPRVIAPSPATDAAAPPRPAIDAASPIAPTPTDAANLDGEPRPIDAGLARADDARRPDEPRHPEADARAAAASARLKVGADPWGEVFVDGHRLGRAPNAWPVAAGKHIVEVVFPSDDGELRRRFPIDVATGGEAQVFADFRGPGNGP